MQKSQSAGCTQSPDSPKREPKFHNLLGARDSVKELHQALCDMRYRLGIRHLQPDEKVDEQIESETLIDALVQVPCEINELVSKAKAIISELVTALD